MNKQSTYLHKKAASNGPPSCRIDLQAAPGALEQGHHICTPGPTKEGLSNASKCGRSGTRRARRLLKGTKGELLLLSLTVSTIVSTQCPTNLHGSEFFSSCPGQQHTCRSGAKFCQAQRSCKITESARVYPVQICTGYTRARTPHLHTMPNQKRSIQCIL